MERLTLQEICLRASSSSRSLAPAPLPPSKLTSPLSSTGKNHRRASPNHYPPSTPTVITSLLPSYWKLTRYFFFYSGALPRERRGLHEDPQSKSELNFRIKNRISINNFIIVCSKTLQKQQLLLHLQNSLLGLPHSTTHLIQHVSTPKHHYLTGKSDYNSKIKGLCQLMKEKRSRNEERISKNEEKEVQPAGTPKKRGRPAKTKMIQKICLKNEPKLER